MGGLGPMAGQNSHFAHAAPEKLPYAIERYVKETARLYGVPDRRLSDREYLAGAHSIADIASYPWIAGHERQSQKLEDFANLKRWPEAIAARPAVRLAHAVATEANPPKQGNGVAGNRGQQERKGGCSRSHDRS